MSIYEIQAEIGKNGLSRPNRYEVVLLPPSGHRGQKNSTESRKNFSQIMSEMLGDGTIRGAGLRCESIDMPGRNVDTTPDTNIYGPGREMATGFSYADVTATFQCSSDMREKRFLETWQRLAYNPHTWSIGYYFDYVGTVQINTFDEQNKKMYGVELVEAFPKNINAQSLSYGTNNSYQTVQCTFVYRYWKNTVDESRIDNKPILLRENHNQTSRRNTKNTPAVVSKLGGMSS